VEVFEHLKKCSDTSREADLSGQVLIASDLQQHLLNAKCASVRMHGATIKGNLDLSWMGSSQRPLPALCFRKCIFVPDDNPTDDKNANLDLSDAHVEALSLKDSQLTHLRAVGAYFHGTVDLSGMHSLQDGDEALCWCKLSTSTITGDLLANRSNLRSRHGHSKRQHLHEKFEWNWALNLAFVRVEGSVIARGCAAIEGGLLMDSAEIDGDVRINGSLIGKDRSPSLSMEGTRVGGSLSLFGSGKDSPVRFVGRIWLMLTEIGGSVDIMRAVLKADSSGIALYVRGASIRGELTVGNSQATGSMHEQNCSVSVDGRIIIWETRTGGSLNVIGLRVHDLRPLDCSWSWIEDAGPCALQVRSCDIEQSFQLIGNNLANKVDLRGTRCRALCDEPFGYQGAGSMMMLDGLRYERIDNGRWVGGISDRLEKWLPGDPDSVSSLSWSPYSPQPFVQLANVLAAHGSEADAWRILSKKALFDTKKLRRERPLPLKAHLIWYWTLRLYGFFFDFGLAPMRALGTLVLFIILGAMLFGVMDKRGALVIPGTPVTSVVKQEGEAPKFSRTEGPSVGDPPCGLTKGLSKEPAEPLETLSRLLVFSADAAIPLIDLHEEDRCDVGKVESENPPRSWEVTLYRYLRALYTVLGWVVTTLAVITFSGVMRHRIERE